MCAIIPSAIERAKRTPSLQKKVDIKLKKELQSKLIMSKLDLVKRCLDDNGCKIKSEDRLPNNTGIQLKLDSGATVNVFDKGTVQVQGPSEIKKTIEGWLAGFVDGTKKVSSNKVFVAYGHDETAKKDLEVMLRRWGLEPLFLDQLPSGGQTIIEKLEHYISDETGYAIVLATPDDEGYRKSHPDEKAYRARQNVVLELGILLAKLGRRHVAILVKQTETMERPSDIQGLVYIPFKDDLQKEAGQLLAKEMYEQGFRIDISKL